MLLTGRMEAPDTRGVGHPMEDGRGGARQEECSPEQGENAVSRGGDTTDTNLIEITLLQLGVVWETPSAHPVNQRWNRTKPGMFVSSQQLLSLISKTMIPALPISCVQISVPITLEACSTRTRKGGTRLSA